ncbi:hypothetical protein MM239_01845 [Belliella sp. DSM 111904]|uniref:Glycosyl hydrolase family 20, domain 2 n=1 Tax=Belliella filtrata TaxID=2923435 RepID=A0ABS9UVM8_9BACT|nr:hypothetical protein [Belliella filtrata]MCH7408124.1 hypothetical protein [Belliella filtrata]
MKTHIIYLLLVITLFSCNTRSEITLILDKSLDARASFGVEKLKEALEEANYEVNVLTEFDKDKSKNQIIIGNWQDELVLEALRTLAFEEGDAGALGKEGFSLYGNGEQLMVRGKDSSGTLYGLLALKDQLLEEGVIDFDTNYSDQPEMVLRGGVIGVQKMEYLPGRKVYEYPYTEENFPWFYDKAHWIAYLDMLVENRMNSLYLWNGHPFASLVKLEDYPYAVEVDEATFQKNEEMFKFLTEEADKRGIWVIQMFYNIIVSKPFAEHHNIATQDRNRPITPLLADYTRKSIAAFIEKYPNVGLLVALGEAMQGEENDIEWFTETVIPGVKDGLQAIGLSEEPPIILRAHDTNAPLVMENALPIYKNLYTMHKYNGESLTTYEPRGPWSQIHKDLSQAGSIHISNVHILANLEPFRYGSPDFIQKSVKAMHEVHGANALHLYPQASYWDWPYTADKTAERLNQIDRDWIWYEAWARYAWNHQRDRDEEIAYWSKKIGDKYGDKQAGKYILDAYEETGEIAPKLLRRFGITEGNRQTLLLGMFGSQLVNPYKWRVYPGFYESCGPEGEILIEYARKEWENEDHVGETPTQIIQEVKRHGAKAVEAIENAIPSVTKDIEEFERLKNDIYCYQAFADFFHDKVEASLHVLRYSYSKNIEDLKHAVAPLEQSVAHFERLVELTKDTYLYANSMQTAQRRIPIGGDDGKHITWEEMLPHYQNELRNLKRNIAQLESNEKPDQVKEEIKPWNNVNVDWENSLGKKVNLKAGINLSKSSSMVVKRVADELESFEGFVLDDKQQIEDGTSLKFKADKPVKLVVGYFNTDQKGYLSPPTLETDAAGNDRGQAEPVILNAIELENLPRVNLHTYSFEAGNHELNLGKGKVLILGFVDGATPINPRDAGLIDPSEKVSVDWVFY